MIGGTTGLTAIRGSTAMRQIDSTVSVSGLGFADETAWPLLYNMVLLAAVTVGHRCA